MSTITIDTNDDVKVLKAIRNLLTELVGETVHAAPESDGDKTISMPAAGLNEGEQLGDVTPDTAADDTAEDTAATSDQVDEFGVGFNAEFCGKAAKPFYASGKRKGQWKKRQGVTDDAYDAWYDSRLEPGAAQTAVNDAPVNTAGAFGGAAETTPAADPAPKDCGSFMGWVSAKQAAGVLTQDDIGAAYAQAQITVTDLFPPNDPATVEKHVTALYVMLAAKAGA